MSSTHQDDRPPKRMRLGTKSCAECRKRKIRCNYPPDSKACTYCLSHKTTCTPQQPKSDPKTINNNSSNDYPLKQDISVLQGMVSRIYKALNLDIATANPADLESNIETIKQHMHVPTPTSMEDAATSVGQSYGSQLGVEDEEEEEFDELNSFDHAPLLNLFREALCIDSPASGSSKGSVSGLVQGERKMDSYIKSVRSIMPNDIDMDQILRMTEKYWFLWKGFDVYTAGAYPDTVEDKVSRARNFIHSLLNSNSPVLVAKAVLNIALCIQQLPKTFDYHKTNLPGSPARLVDSYADAANILLLSDTSTTLNGLECGLLQYRFHINMGKPRKAWLCVQRAISSGILLGLNRPEGRTKEREKEIWCAIWQMDRILSISIGVPYTVQTSWIDASMRRGSDADKVMFDLCDIAGRVIDRDQQRPSPDYSITEEIERDCQRCVENTPIEWWEMAMGPETPLDILYGVSATKAFFFLVRKLLHLPYMLKSLTDTTYEKSQITAQYSSRKIIGCYQDIRNYSGDSLIICDSMDFQAFSAALTASIYLLSPGAQTGSHQEMADWLLIKDTTENLSQVARSLDCHVASQSATLLKYLYETRYGISSQQESYEAIIPYFGKVRIGGLRNSNSIPATETVNQEVFTPPSIFGNVEFSTNFFDYNYMGNCLDGGAELGVDWTYQPFDTAPDFNWSQVYEAPISWSQ